MRDPAAVAQLAADAARGQRLRAEFPRADRGDARAARGAVREGRPRDDEKRAGKAAVFAAHARGDTTRRKAASDGSPAFDRWFAGGANNAGIVAVGALRRPGPAVQGAARRGRRRSPALLRPGQGAGGPAQGRARDRARSRSCRRQRCASRAPAAPSTCRYPLVLQSRNRLYFSIPLPHPLQTGEAARRRRFAAVRPTMTRRSALHASLRSRFHRASRSERAGARDDRALPHDHHRQERPDPPARGLGPPPARLPDRQDAQGALRADEHRDRPGDAGRARARVQVQRRRAAPPDRRDGRSGARAVADDARREGEARARRRPRRPR